MTDSPETKTAEQIVARAMGGGNRAYSTHDVQVGAVVAALREAGLLVSGAPSEEQIDDSENQDADLLHEQLNAWQDERERVSKYARLLIDTAAVRPEVAALDVGHHLQGILGEAK